MVNSLFKKDVSPLVKQENIQSVLKPQVESKTKKVSRVLVIILLLLAVGGVGGSLYFYNKYRSLKIDPNIEAKKITESLVKELGELMELPKEETPTVATISDKEKLTNQPFFKMAENGDVLFAYTSSMKAILYRPSTKKIINVAPITINQTEDNSVGVKQGAQASAMKVAYYNGTDIVGLSVNTEKIVKSKFPTAESVSLTNAVKKDYVGTLVVDISKKFSQQAGDIAALLKGKIGNMPPGETAPNADILIISGK